MTREEQIRQYCEDMGFPLGSCSSINSIKAQTASDAIKWADKNRPVDWQQVRIQASIAAMQSLRSNTGYNQCAPVEIAKFSITYADALVKELKGE